MASIFRMIRAAVLLMVCIVPGAGRSLAETAPTANLSVDALRRMVLLNLNALSSLEVSYRSWHYENRDTHDYLDATMAAKGEMRFASQWHGEAGTRAADPEAVRRFYDGTQFNGEYFRQYEITEKFAVPPYTDKVRSHAFMEVLGWWPATDDSSPPAHDVIECFFLAEALADEALRVAAYQEEIEGHWCHVVINPKRDRLWIDSKLGVVRKRELLAAYDPEHVLITFSQNEFRHVEGEVWLPYRLRRTYHPANYDVISHVQQYQINGVSNERFSFEPPPGTLIHDRDTDEFRQVPGGFDTMEKVVRWIHAACEDDTRGRERRANYFSIVGLFGMGAVCYWTVTAAGSRAKEGQHGT